MTAHLQKIIPLSLILFFFFFLNLPFSWANHLLVVVDSTTISAEGTLLKPIGLESQRGTLTPLLAKDCHLPCRSTFILKILDHSPKSLTFDLYEGDGQRVSEAHLIGRFEIEGVTLNQENEAEVEVTLTARSRNIFLSAKERASQQSYHIKMLEDEKTSQKADKNPPDLP